VSAGKGTDPFRALGLTADPELGDDDVRAAWRRVAAATHPDRADGGDPAAFAAAAAAYTALRTPSGRGEELADLFEGERRHRTAGLPLRLAAFAPGALLAATRVRRGRPLVLLARLCAAAAACALPVAIAGWQPASYAILAGILTWLAVTVRSDLAPPP
jgi:hypothetical protein